MNTITDRLAMVLFAVLLLPSFVNRFAASHRLVAVDLGGHASPASVGRTGQ